MRVFTALDVGACGVVGGIDIASIALEKKFFGFDLGHFFLADKIPFYLIFEKEIRDRAINVYFYDVER